MAQKKLHKMILVDDINLIQINTANCFKVELNTRQAKEINVEAEIEGEYIKDLDLEVKTIGSTILIEAGFVPSFENPNDKLSAHKVVSILLRLTIPTFKNVELYGTNSRVMVNGEFKKLKISLSDGICELNDIQGEAFVNTQSGTIKVLANAAVIKANSRYGNVEFNPISPGISNYELQTVTGNIELSKIK